MAVAKNEEVPPSETCKQTTHANWISLAKKNKQAPEENTGKNKASRQIHIQTQKQTSKQIHAQLI